jgi:hypothetical protein
MRHAEREELLDARQLPDQRLGQRQLPVRDRCRRGQVTGFTQLVFPEQGLNDQHATARAQQCQALPASSLN